MWKKLVWSGVLVGACIAPKWSPAFAGDNDGGHAIVAHVCAVPKDDGKSIDSKERWGHDWELDTGNPKTTAKDDYFDHLETDLEHRSHLHFQTILVDTAGGWDPDEDTYTVPENGLYQVTYKSEVTHDPRFSMCLHIWMQRDGQIYTLYSKNSLEQSPKYAAYPVVTKDADGNWRPIAFQPMIDTAFYFYKGDVIYPMWIQFYPPYWDDGKGELKSDIHPSTGSKYCENQFFKIAKIGN